MNRSSLSVLMFSNASVRAGVEEHILQLLRGLDRKYFRLYLACTPELAELLRPDLPTDVKMLAVRIMRPTQVLAIATFMRFLRAEHIQIVHAHGFRSSLMASPLAKLAGVPLTVETPHAREYWRKGLKAYYGVDRFIGRYVDAYISVSDSCQDYLINTKGLPREKMHVIRSASDVRTFDPTMRPPAGLKRDLGFDESDPVLLVLGRLEDQKGHRVLLQAMPAVLRRFPKVRLAIVGEGSLRQQLEALTCNLGIDHAVRFMGRQPEIREWLALCDISVLPSFFEGLPLTAIESLAAGKPMIATAVDGTPEVIRDGETGLTVPPGDPGRLADAICRMLGEPELRDTCARNGRRLVEKSFSLESLICETETLYKQLWEGKRSMQPLPARRPAAVGGGR